MAFPWASYCVSVVLLAAFEAPAVNPDAFATAAPFASSVLTSTFPNASRANRVSGVRLVPVAVEVRAAAATAVVRPSAS